MFLCSVLSPFIIKLYHHNTWPVRPPTLVITIHNYYRLLQYSTYNIILYYNIRPTMWSKHRISKFLNHSIHDYSNLIIKNHIGSIPLGPNFSETELKRFLIVNNSILSSIEFQRSELGQQTDQVMACQLKR